MSDYWENRAAWDMYHAMEDAEKTAQRIDRIYRKALTQLTYAARDVFDKYRKDYGLSEVEAWELLNKMQDKASIDELSFLRASRSSSMDALSCILFKSSHASTSESP